MQAEILNISGKKTSKKAELAEAIFNAEPNDHCIYLDVKQFLANQRQGTHKSKERAEIHRTTKKLKRQKGTGGARAGSMKSPLFIGGGRAFGPRPRDYSFKLNKKVKRLARISALTYKAKDNAITIVEDFNFEAPKTKNYSDLLVNLNLTGKKTLLVLPDHNKNVYLSARNLQGAKVVNATDINTYDILNAGNVIIAEGSLKVIENILS
ncbi:MAG TPA: 50S ribosomal protein L4 [Bacteroidia bacterium]|nr:50S ribosomal protein L4 [Bacteroidia bacterium]